MFEPLKYDKIFRNNFKLNALEPTLFKIQNLLLKQFIFGSIRKALVSHHFYFTLNSYLFKWRAHILALQFQRVSAYYFWTITRLVFIKSYVLLY